MTANPDSAMGVDTALDSTLRLGRRDFLRFAATSGVAAALATTVLGRSNAFAAVVPGSGPYGALQAANADGIALPVGFTSRLIAVSGQAVASTGYTWHTNPDGGACFASPSGEWVYVSNSEVNNGGGGVSAIRFAANGQIVSAYRILSGTTWNCAGGLSETGTWLSCEENDAAGQVYECNPQAPSQGVVRPALGKFSHEAAFADPATGHVYMTEDKPDSRFYRFVPTTRGDLSAGQLFAASVSGGVITWIPTSASAPDRQSSTTAFNGGEGLWIHQRQLYFTTKGDKRVWQVNLDTMAIGVLYDGVTTPNAALNAVDNVTMHVPSGDLFIAEDGGNMEVCLIGAVNGQTEVSAFLRFDGHASSEVTGPAFSPDGTRLYVSSQRGTNNSVGRTYEITGPFRGTGIPPIGSETLVPTGATWKYLDTGIAPAGGWKAPGFNEAGWKQGAAPLGYGDPVTTTVGFGPLATRRYITTWFRHSFTPTHGYTGMTLRMRRDDGAVVYMNGVEVARSNMPGGTITPATLASTSVGGSDETAYYSIAINPTLYSGTNVIAVELHQSAPDSSDLSFDLELTATGNTGALPAPPWVFATDALVPVGSQWRYRDTGVAPALSWTTNAFNDSTWAQGAAPLGYGDPVRTTVRYGPSSRNRYITTWFRRSFTASFRYQSMELRLRRDDGAVIYVNGVEVARSNMPTGTVTQSTLASSAIGGAAETAFITIPISATLLNGANVIAVELHQAAANSSDLSFDLALSGTNRIAAL